jgi:hypothetical protein
MFDSTPEGVAAHQQELAAVVPAARSEVRALRRRNRALRLARMVGAIPSTPRRRRRPAAK